VPTDAHTSELYGFKKLEVWQKSMDLVSLIYKTTQSFPRDELFGLTSQIRRATVSIPANIAEGAGRRSKAEYANHCGIARGSSAEVMTLVEIARREGLIEEQSAADLDRRITQIVQMLTGLIRSLERLH
jgi:four helix bundle protein